MRMKGFNVTAISCIIMLMLGISGSASLFSVGSFLGVAPEDEDYFKGLSSRGSIKCKDGSRKFNKSQLNDDFCDCPDGSDEPGTSACPSGKFFCKNRGHTPLLLYSSRVNDGICDCCDGSDEYNSEIKCSNTCWEAGKVARDKLKKRISTYHEGVTIRKREIEQAKLAMAKEEAELSKLKSEEKVLSGLVQQLKEHKEQIEEVEEKERLQKEKEEKERKEAEDAKEKEFTAAEKSEDAELGQNDVNNKIDIQDHPAQDFAEGHHKSVNEPEHIAHVVEEVVPRDGEQESKADSPQDTELKSEGQIKVKADLDTHGENIVEGTESLSPEELGRLVASRWTGEKTGEKNEQSTKELDAVPDKDQDNVDEKPDGSNDEEYSSYDSEEDAHEYDDEDGADQVDDFEGDIPDDSSPSYKPLSDDESDFSDITSTTSPTWLEKIQKTVKSILKAVNLFQTPIDKSEAARIRKEYDESSAKLSKLQSRISSLTQKLKKDFGKEKEFHSFYGQCFESKENKYTYKICPFKQATQEEGYTTTRLGNWEKFEDDYRIIQFSGGDKCWNGPDRSLKVKLRCGLKNELTDIDEPSRCEYLALLSTPALCLDSKLKELQEKLEALNKEQPSLGHDEL